MAATRNVFLFLVNADSSQCAEVIQVVAAGPVLYILLHCSCFVVCFRVWLRRAAAAAATTAVHK